MIPLPEALRFSPDGLVPAIVQDVTDGTVLMLATKGDDVELNPGQKLSVHLTSATNMPVVARK